MANLTTQILDKVAAPSRGVAQNHLGTPVSRLAGPIENLRACPQFGLPAAPRRASRLPAKRVQFESPSLRQIPLYARTCRVLQKTPHISRIPCASFNPAEMQLPS